jgi:hypothetical protein
MFTGYTKCCPALTYIFWRKPVLLFNGNGGIFPTVKPSECRVDVPYYGEEVKNNRGHIFILLYDIMAWKEITFFFDFTSLILELLMISLFM